MTQTTLTTTQLLEAMTVLAEVGFITIVDKDPVKVDQLAKSKNGGKVEITQVAARKLMLRYKTAETAADLATAMVTAIKKEVQTLMGDATELQVKGVVDPIATFRFGAMTTFDKDSARKESPALIEKYTTTDPEGKRTFRFPGVHVG